MHIYGGGREMKVAVDKFREGCSGAVLIAEPDKNSIEPNFKENKQAGWVRILKKNNVGNFNCNWHNIIYHSIGHIF